MKIFDLRRIKPDDSSKNKLFYNNDNFNMRIIDLSPGQGIPECKMDTHVMFNVLEGEAKIKVNEEEKELGKGQCLVTEPATLSMKTEKGVKILGIQINQTRN